MNLVRQKDKQAIKTVLYVLDPVLSFPIWNNSTPSLLIKLTVLVLEQENTILPSERKEHPVMTLPLMFIF
jgi:hypothetical protein